MFLSGLQWKDIKELMNDINYFQQCIFCSRPPYKNWNHMLADLPLACSLEFYSQLSECIMIYPLGYIYFSQI